MTALPLGDDLARLDLSLEPESAEPGGELDASAPASPSVTASPCGSRPSPGNRWSPGLATGSTTVASGRLDMLGIAASFGTSALPARGELRSGPIHLSGTSPESGPLVIKVVGTDPRGRRVCAWADLSPASPAADGGP